MAGKFNRLARRVAWLGFALALTVLLGAGLLIMIERRSEIDAWRQRASSLSSLMSLTMGQTFTAADVLLGDIVTDIARFDLSTPQEFERFAASPLIDNMLNQKMAGASHLASLGLVSVDGSIINETSDNGAPDGQLQKPESDKADRATVGTPYVDRTSGRKLLPIWRAISSRTGERLGMAYALFELGVLERHARQGASDGSMSVAVMRRDGVVLAAAPPESTEAAFRDALLKVNAFETQGGVWTTALAPQSHASGWPLGIVAVAPVENHDMLVATLVQESQVLKRWRNWSVIAAAAALAISTLLVMFTLFVSRVLVWQDRMLAEVAAARDAAELASRAKTSFLSLVSHEFRTPLSALIGSADLLGLEGAAKDKAQYARIIAASARQLLTLIDNVLGLTRLEHQKFERKSAPFSLRDLMANAMVIGRTLVGGKKIALDCIIDAEAPDRLTGDAGAFSQIVLNLVSNAVKYTPKGEVRVRLNVVKADPLTLELVVSDTGIGISPDMLGRLFQPFERGNSDRVRVEAGTGLGLAITERLVAGMGGTIEAHNDKGGGAVFTVSLPFVIADDEATLSERAVAKERLDPLSILLVEDSSANRLVLKAMLESLGHTVATASDGQVAVEKATHADFDLIVMDVQMPVMDGYEATRRIRAMDRHRETPMIALTAFTEQEHCDRAREAGLDRVLAKPARLPDLDAVTRSISPRRASGTAA